MCSLCQILIRFFWSMFSWSSFSKKSPTLADYLFSLHFFESVIVGQILTLCWNPQLPVKFPFLLLHLHFLFVTTNKNTIFRGKSPYFWWLPRRNHHFFLHNLHLYITAFLGELTFNHHGSCDKHQHVSGWLPAMRRDGRLARHPRKAPVAALNGAPHRLQARRCCSCRG